MVVNLTRFVCICDYHIIQFIYVHWTRKPWKWQNFRSSVLREFGAYSQSLKVNVGYYCIKEPKDKDDSDASNDHIILSPNRVGQNKKYFETPFLVLLHKEIAKKKRVLLSVWLPMVRKVYWRWKIEIRSLLFIQICPLFIFVSAWLPFFYLCKIEL